VQLISAVVRLTKVDDICDAVQVFGFRGLTVTDATGYGKHRGGAEMYRGAQYSSKYERRAKIEIVVPDEDVQDIVDLICKVAGSGRMGDGKIWISPIREVVRIRTHEAGIDAL
jgi:nitrogen regulatory protein PII